MQTGEDNRAAINEQAGERKTDGFLDTLDDALKGEIAKVIYPVADEFGLDVSSIDRVLEMTTIYSELEIAAAEIVVSRPSYDKSTSVNIEDALDKAAEALKLGAESKVKVLQLLDKYSQKEIIVAYIIMDRLTNIKISVDSHNIIT